MANPWKIHAQDPFTGFYSDRADSEYRGEPPLISEVSEEFLEAGDLSAFSRIMTSGGPNSIGLFDEDAGFRDSFADFEPDVPVEVDSIDVSFANPVLNGVGDPIATIYVPTLTDILSGKMHKNSFGVILKDVLDYRFGGDIEAMVAGTDQDAGTVENYIAGRKRPMTMVDAGALAKEFDLDTFGLLLAWINDWKDGFAKLKRSNHGGQEGAFKVKVLINVATMLKNGIFPKLPESLGFTGAMDWASFMIGAGFDEDIVLDAFSHFVGNFPAIIAKIHDQNGEFMASFGKDVEWNAMVMRIASRHFQKTGDYDKAYLAALNGGKALEDMDGLDGVGRTDRTGEKLRFFDESIAMARKVPELIEGLRRSDFLQYAEDIRQALDELKQGSWLTSRLEVLERGGGSDGFSIGGIERVLEEVRVKGMAEEDMLVLSRFFLQNGINFSAFSHFSFRHLWGVARGGGLVSVFGGSLADQLERLDALIDGRVVDEQGAVAPVFLADKKMSREKIAAEALINSAALRMEIEVPVNEKAIRPHNAVSYVYLSILAGFDAMRAQRVMGGYLAQRFNMTPEQAVKGGADFIRRRRPDIAAIHMGIASRYFEEKGEYVEATRMSLAAAGLLEGMDAELVHVREVTREMRRQFFSEARRLAKRIRGKQFKRMKELLLSGVDQGRQILKREGLHDGVRGIDVSTGEVSWFANSPVKFSSGSGPQVEHSSKRSKGVVTTKVRADVSIDFAEPRGGARVDIAGAYAELDSNGHAGEFSHVVFSGLLYSGVDEVEQSGMTAIDGSELQVPDEMTIVAASSKPGLGATLFTSAGLAIPVFK